MTTIDVNGVIGSTTAPAFRLSGTRTHVGKPAEGLLINMRMVAAIFDDMNSGTYAKWRYPGGGTYDPARQTNEFVAQLAAYQAAGVDAVTISLMGALTDPAATSFPWPWDSCAFNTDGTRPTTGARAGFWTRLDQALTALDAQGMVAIVQLLYQHEMNRLANATAVNTAADAWVDWILAKTYRNVIFSIGNEVDNAGYTFSVDTDSGHGGADTGRIGLLGRIRARLIAGGWTAPLVGLSYGSNPTVAYPTNAVIPHADWVGFSNNSNTAGNITTRLATIRGYANYIAAPIPLLVVEDNSFELYGSTGLDRYAAAVNHQASTGLYIQGAAGSFAGGDYQTGFQSVPSAWGLLNGNGGLTGSADATKKLWMDWALSVTGGSSGGGGGGGGGGGASGITTQWETSTSGAHGSWSDQVGQTALALQLQSGDATHWKRARMIATNSFGTTNEWTPRVGPIASGGTAPAFSTRPAVTGSTIVGSTLTTDGGTLTGDPAIETIAWQESFDGGASWVPIIGANTSTYTLTLADLGALLQSVVTATNSTDTAIGFSDPTAAVTQTTTFPNLQLAAVIE